MVKIAGIKYYAVYPGSFGHLAFLEECSYPRLSAGTSHFLFQAQIVGDVGGITLQKCLSLSIGCR